MPGRGGQAARIFRKTSADQAAEVNGSALKRSAGQARRTVPASLWPIDFWVSSRDSFAVVMDIEMRCGYGA